MEVVTADAEAICHAVRRCGILVRDGLVRGHPHQCRCPTI